LRSSLSNFRIAGLTVTTGSVERDFIADGLAAGLDRAQLERVSAAVGLKKRLIAPPGVTALDLCEDAARRLLAALDVDPSSIDAVVFVTQTPDHPQPNNASLLHGRLGLAKSVLSYDLNHGCSGWIYGLHQAALLCAHGGAARVLLCAGDTLSRLTNPADRSLDPIFGDAGSATLVERTGRSEPWHFEFGTDDEAKLGAMRKEFIDSLFRILQEQVEEARGRTAATERKAAPKRKTAPKRKKKTARR